MATAKCHFCGREQEDYKGVYLVKNDGSVLYFSSGKCAKNFLKLGRDRRRIKWAEAFHVSRKKRISKEKERTKKTKDKEVDRKGKK